MRPQTLNRVSRFFLGGEEEKKRSRYFNFSVIAPLLLLLLIFFFFFERLTGVVRVLVRARESVSACVRAREAAWRF